MRTPTAQPIPQVARSRRDDRYQAGRPTPIKRAASGWVVSVQEDTVTVMVSGENLTGVIPLGDMPTVGAIVEVESRGDLLVIPTWFEGPPPPGPAIVVDVFLTRGRLIWNPPGTGSDLDVFLDLPADAPVTLQVTTDGYGMHFYPVEYDGHDASGVDFIPATPDGYELTDLRPFVKAHTAAGSQTTIGEDTSSWGYFPAPTKSPYLVTTHSHPLLFDTFPAGTDPTGVIVCGAGILPPVEEYQSNLHIEKWSGTSSTCDVVLSEYGWRFTYTEET